MPSSVRSSATRVGHERDERVREHRDRAVGGGRGARLGDRDAGLADVGATACARGARRRRPGARGTRRGTGAAARRRRAGGRSRSSPRPRRCGPPPSSPCRSRARRGGRAARRCAPSGPPRASRGGGESPCRGPTRRSSTARGGSVVLEARDLRGAHRPDAPCAARRVERLEARDRVVVGERHGARARPPRRAAASCSGASVPSEHDEWQCRSIIEPPSARSVPTALRHGRTTATRPPIAPCARLAPSCASTALPPHGR